MKRDETTYTTATSAALAGLAVQCVLCLGTGAVGAWTESPAIIAATWHIAGGIPIWIILAIIYQQHRLERTEALAAEKLATQDAASAALFGDVSDELQLIRSRLDRLYNLGLPIVSFTIAIYLIAAGVGMLYRAATLAADPVALATLNALGEVPLRAHGGGVERNPVGGRHLRPPRRVRQRRAGLGRRQARGRQTDRPLRPAG